MRINILNLDDSLSSFLKSKFLIIFNNESMNSKFKYKRENKYKLGGFNT